MPDALVTLTTVLIMADLPMAGSPVERLLDVPLPNTKWETFAQHYALHGNAADAARAAGFSVRTARTRGNKLLAQAAIRSRVAGIQAARARATIAAPPSAGVVARRQAESSQILGAVDTLALSDIRQLFDLSTDEGAPLRFKPVGEWPDAVALCVSSVKVRQYPEGLPAFDRDELTKIREGIEALDEKAIDPTLRRELIALAGAAWHRYSITEIKLWDKVAGLDKAMKARGLYNKDVSKMTSEELDRLELELYERAAERRRAAMKARGVTS